LERTEAMDPDPAVAKENTSNKISTDKKGGNNTRLYELKCLKNQMILNSIGYPIENRYHGVSHVSLYFNIISLGNL